jgi:hypothetical protein
VKNSKVAGARPPVAPLLLAVDGSPSAHETMTGGRKQCTICIGRCVASASDAAQFNANFSSRAARDFAGPGRVMELPLPSGKRGQAGDMLASERLLTGREWLALPLAARCRRLMPGSERTAGVGVGGGVRRRRPGRGRTSQQLAWLVAGVYESAGASSRPVHHRCHAPATGARPVPPNGTHRTQEVCDAQ